MGVSDFSSLKQYVINRVARDDYGDQQASDDVTFAEAMINRKLHIRKDVSDVVTLSTVAGTRSYDLPTGFQAMNSIGYADRGQLRQVSPQEMASRDASITDRPYEYAISGNKLTFYPTPNAVFDILYTYYGKLEGLSDSNTTNWMLDEYPDVYCDAILFYAMKRFRDPLALEFKNMAEMSLDELNVSYRMNSTSIPLDMRHNVIDEV